MAICSYVPHFFSLILYHFLSLLTVVQTLSVCLFSTALSIHSFRSIITTTPYMPSSGTAPSTANFRQSLISRVVPDESVKLDQILSEQRDIDIFQFKQFVWKYSLPDKQRFLVWKLLLGVTSGHPEIRETIEKHRSDEAESLWRSLKTMRLAESDGIPMPSDIVRMILLARGDLRADVDFRAHEVAPIVTIVHHMRTVAGFDRWSDAFALARAAHRLFHELFPPRVIEHILVEVNKQVDLRALGITLLPEKVRAYMHSGGSAIFKSTKALQKLWDKLLSGDESPPFLMTQLLVSYINFFYFKQNGNSRHTGLDNFCLADEDEMRLVNQSIEAILRKPNFKVSNASGSSSTTTSSQHSSIMIPLLRGEPVRKSDCDHSPPSPTRKQSSSGVSYGVPSLPQTTLSSAISQTLTTSSTTGLPLSGLSSHTGRMPPQIPRMAYHAGVTAVDEGPRKRAATISEAKLRTTPMM